jgi:hypothetical protein
MRSKLALGAFLAAFVAGAVCAFAPLGSVTQSVEGPGVHTTRSYSTSLFSTDGAWVLVVVGVPILIALAGTLIPARAARMVAAALLWACCLIGLMSVGLFFVPTAVLMTLAATRTPQSAPPAPASV